MPRTANLKCVKWQLDEKEDEIFIYVTGLTEQNETIHVRIKGFEPFVYLEVPDSFPVERGMSLLQRGFSQWGIVPTKIKYEKKYLCMHLKEAKFYKLYFETSKNIRALQYILKRPKYVGGVKYQFRLHEQAVNPLIKFATVQNIQLGGWINVTEQIDKSMKSTKSTKGSDNFSNCDIDMNVFHTKVKYLPDKTDRINPSLFSFDIENYSINKNSKSPNAEIKANRIFQIAVQFGRIRNDCDSFSSHLVTTNNCPLIDGTEVINCKNERDLIIAFCKLLMKCNPDIITGYNILKYDWDYIIKRSKIVGCLNHVLMCSRNNGEKSKIDQIKWSSGAYGEQIFNFLNPYGMMNIDVYPEIERNYKLNTYSLNSVSKEFLNDEKEDVSYKQMFTLFEMSCVMEKLFDKGEIDLDVLKNEVNECMEPEDYIVPTHDYEFRNHVLEVWNCVKQTSNIDDFTKSVREGIKRIGVYCIQDTKLPVRLFQKLHLWEGLQQMSNITGIPMWMLQIKGQQIKVFAQIYRRTHYANVVIEDSSYFSQNTQKYMGATVIEAHPGLYEDIVTLDFASLYPSIMIANNMCPTTLIENDDPIKDEDCNVIAWDEHRGCKCGQDTKVRNTKVKAENVLCGSHKHRFHKVVRDENNVVISGREGLIPKLLGDILSERKKVKKKIKIMKQKIKIMKQNGASDDEVFQYEADYNIYDKRQLGLKISANSTYGFFGATKGYYPVKEIAASVTAYGRYLIKETRDIAIEKFGVKVVYGDTDSVMILFKTKNVKEIFKKGKECADYISSQFVYPIELEFESLYKMYLLLTMKRYLCKEIDIESNVIGKVKKGVVSKRRDNCEFLRDVYNKIIDLILNNGSKEQVMNTIVDSAYSLFTKNHSDKKFVLYKGINDVDSYDEESHVSHVMLARKMKERGDEVPPNTRLAYLFLVNNKKGALQGEKVEEWQYYLENKYKLNLKIDYLYYLEKQLVKPLNELLSVMYPGEEYVYEKHDDRIVNEFVRIFTNLIKNNKIELNEFVVNNLLDRLIPINKCSSNKKRLDEIDDALLFVKKALKRSDAPMLYMYIRYYMEYTRKKYDSWDTHDNSQNNSITSLFGLKVMSNSNNYLNENNNKKFKKFKNLKYLEQCVGDEGMKLQIRKYHDREILDKVYKKFGVKKRAIKRPKQNQTTIKKDCKLMKEFYTNHMLYHEVVKQLKSYFSPMIEFVDDDWVVEGEWWGSDDEI